MSGLHLRTMICSQLSIRLDQGISSQGHLWTEAVIYKVLEVQLISFLTFYTDCY